MKTAIVTLKIYATVEVNLEELQKELGRRPSKRDIQQHVLGSTKRTEFNTEIEEIELVEEEAKKARKGIGSY